MTSARPSAARRTTAAVVVVLGLCGGACSAGTADRSPDPTASASPVGIDEALRAELLQMQVDDQLERTGEGLPPGTRLPPMQDYTRAKRLQEIIDEHGWPTHSLVGEDGASAAWLVAQHADFDVDFQDTALTLMREAAERGEVDVTEVAYLADRVAVNLGIPQTHGTQVRCRDGRPRPATPIADRAGIDVRRAAAGMESLMAYYDTLEMMCANEAAEGLESGP